MAKVEIDEAEFVRLSKLNNFAHGMLSNPDAARLLEKAAKIVDPNIKTPRLDQDAAIQTPMQKLQEDMSALRKQMEDERSESSKNQTLAALGQQREEGFRALRRAGWTDDGVAAVEKIMDEKGILDPEIAAAYFEKLHPPQQLATPSGSGAWNFMEQSAEEGADIKKLIEVKGEGLVVDKMARDALNEIRGQSRR